MKIKIVFFIFLLFSNLYSLDNFSKETIEHLTLKYGDKTERKLTAWNRLLKDGKKVKMLKKLKLTNDFFNHVRYATDIRHWKQRDYWATPFEFIGTSAGDCEDYAITKYFTLIKMGIPQNKLRLAYVKLLRKKTKFEEDHMVLLYIHKPNKTPIVLDNANKKLKMATQRKDLKLIYTFNASGLWNAKNRGKQVRVSENRLKKWEKLISFKIE
jgi:predicted transglutaminase-like cysteine proteinase